MKRHQQAAVDVGLAFVITLLAAVPWVGIVFMTAPIWMYIVFAAVWLVVIGAVLRYDAHR